ncbi:Uncharacterized protein Rs2_19258 [Raphanus sativus]|nr:Uncharacterized protein Rs2_19258 [Raphanus sativus]
MSTPNSQFLDLRKLVSVMNILDFYKFVFIQKANKLDSNDFCTNLSLPPRIYGAGTEPPDIPKMVIQHSSIDYVSEVAQILGNEEFDQIENSHIGNIVKLAKK